jgi:hypothetical protein
MQRKFLCLVASLALASCGGPHTSPPPPTRAPATARAPATECDRVAASTNQGMFQYIAIVAPSRDDVLGLDLLHLEGLSLSDHPSTDKLADGRVSLGTLATDAAIATLCARGCTRERNCDILVIISKEQLLSRWNELRCEVEPEPGAPRNPVCGKPHQSAGSDSEP